MQKYVFRKYMPKYAAFFSSEKKRLQKALGSFAKIEHVGSTAITGLGGKGIIDIVVGVPKTKFKEAKKCLERGGYEFREIASTSERFFFRRDLSSGKRKRRVHVHLTIRNGKDWQEMIGFRDYLLYHPDTIEEYAKLKKEAAKKALGVGEIYRKHKEKFIKTLTKKALLK